jgi:hypothetical protein
VEAGMLGWEEISEIMGHGIAGNIDRKKIIVLEGIRDL